VVCEFVEQIARKKCLPAQALARAIEMLRALTWEELAFAAENLEARFTQKGMAVEASAIAGYGSRMK
jgi:hypothetical protein